MRKNKKLIFKKAVSALMTVTMIVPSYNIYADTAVSNVISINTENCKTEEDLKEAIRESDELETKYPNGLFNFLGTQYKVNETNDYIEVAIIRQGGTKGKESVRFKTIDVSSKYGEDYIICTDKDDLDSALKVNKNASPLIETAKEKNVDISYYENEENNKTINGQGLVEAMVTDVTTNSSEEEKDDNINSKDLSTESLSTENINIEDLSTENISTESSEEKSNESVKPKSLRDAKASYLGKQSDRPDWQEVTDDEKSDEIRENYNIFFEALEGVETTLTFEDGEYIKYVYIIPTDDDISESEEQLMMVLLEDENSNAKIGSSYTSYCNIVDNEEKENVNYSFKDDVKIENGKATFTIVRNTGIEQYSTVYIGTEEDTAIAGADYVSGTQELFFIPGETEKTISIDILENEYRNTDRTFNVLLTEDGENVIEDTVCVIKIPKNISDNEEIKEDEVNEENKVTKSSQKKTSLQKQANTTTSNKAEKLTANGWSPAKGQWAVPTQDLTYSNKSNVKSSGSETKFTHTGGSYSATNNSLRFYGVDSLTFWYCNVGDGRNYKQSVKYPYQVKERVWGFLWYKTVTKYKTVIEEKNEKEYTTLFKIGNKTLLKTKGYEAGTDYNKGLKEKLDTNLWNATSFGFYSQANNDNKANTTIGWLRLALKEYNINCVNSKDLFYINEYTLSDTQNASLGKSTKQTNITPTLKIEKINSNVGNDRNVNGKSSSAYRSDYIQFKLDNFNSSYLSFNGIEASFNGKNWVKVSDGYNVLLNADFYQKFSNYFSSSNIQFRPVFSQNKTTIEFNIADGNNKKGKYSNLTSNQKFSLNVGDTINNVIAKGNVSSYQPTFYFGNGSSKNNAQKNVNSNSSSVKFTNSAKNIINVTAGSGYNVVKLSFDNPTLTVKADPADYANKVANVKYIIDGKTYDGSDENFRKYLETNVYNKNNDKQIELLFSYEFDNSYANGTSSKSKNFGKTKNAELKIYDSNGDLKSTKILQPTTTNGDNFKISGKILSELDWQKADVATVTIYGTITSTLETPIDFVGNSGINVIIYGEDGKLTSESIGSIDKSVVVKDANPLSTYNVTALTPIGFIARWRDGSIDTNNDGNLEDTEQTNAQKRLEELGYDFSNKNSLFYDDLYNGTLFYGNTLSYAPALYSDSVIYYDISKITKSSVSNKIFIKLAEQTCTVLTPNTSLLKPLKDANITINGNILEYKGVEGNYAIYEGENSLYDKGSYFLVDIEYKGYTRHITAQGRNTTQAEIETSSYMMPNDFSVTIDGKKQDLTSCQLATKNEDTTFSYNFDYTKTGVKVNKSKIYFYNNKGELAYTDVISRNDVDKNFEYTINLQKAGIKAGYTMKISGIYDDGTVEREYPPVDVGVTFMANLTAITILSSFNTPFKSTLKLIGKVSTRFDLPLDYDFDNGNSSMFQKVEYELEDGTKVVGKQLAFGYNSEAMEEIKKIITEKKANGDNTSSRKVVNEYVKNLFESDSKKDDAEETSKKSEELQDKDKTQNNSARSSTFNYDFNIAVILTIESGVTDKIDDSGVRKSDGHWYFNSLVVVASGNADFGYSVSYVTPIGIPIIAELAVGGKAGLAFAVESDDRNPYADGFNLTKDSDDKVSGFKIDECSIYTKFLLKPYITVGGGVGVDLAKVTLSGTADFDFGFTAPIIGENESSDGSGGVTLSIDLGLKILFVNKSWTLYKSDRINLFSYGTSKTSASDIMLLLNEKSNEYLYDEIDKISDDEILTRDYLDNRSSWQPQIISAKSVSKKNETKLLEGAYPYPETKLVDLGNDNLLMLFVDDAEDRDDINRAILKYALSNDGGISWSKPIVVSDDGTWDEAPDAFLIDDKVLITWSDASRKFNSDDTEKTILSSMDISGVWFDTKSMKMGDEFAITQTTDYDKYSDVTPMISYDEQTKKLMVYYTKVDYETSQPYETSEYEKDKYEKSISDEDKTLYGDIVNGYNVIAYRYAEYNEETESFVWNEEYKDGETSLEGFYGQRFLDLAIPATIKETQTEVKTGETYEIEDSEGNIVTRDITENTTNQEIIVSDTYSSLLNDPRIIDSDLISYNGLAIYAYTMDFDANTSTTDDQQLYIQIYNYEEDTFHHPIQITSDTKGNSKPQFVRVKDTTFLYWISGGDIVYMDVSYVVNNGLTMKTITVPVWEDKYDKNGNYIETVKNGTKDIKMYILDKTNQEIDAYVTTAVEHQVSEPDENGDVQEDFISDFDVVSNNNSLYLLWTDLVTGYIVDPADGGSETDIENVSREQQIFGAYYEHNSEIQEITCKFEDTESIKYNFVNGKGNDTYPVSYTYLQDGTDNDTGKEIKAGDTEEIDYSTYVDLNGNTGVVKAGDPATKKVELISDGYGWSKPIQVTTEKGANYSDISFRVTDDNNIQATFVKCKSNLVDGVFKEDLANKELAVATFKVTSDIKLDDIELDKQTYYPNDMVTVSADITNDGFKVIKDTQYKVYATKNGEVIDETEWQSVQDGVIIGGDTVNISGSISLTENIDDVKVGIKVQDSNGDLLEDIAKDIEVASKFELYELSKSIVDENTANISVRVANTGNKDYTGKVSITSSDNKVLFEEDVQIPYGEYVDITEDIDISDIKFSDVVVNEDGSKSDSITLKLNVEDTSSNIIILRTASSDIVKAFDGVKKFAIEKDGKTIKDGDTITIKDNEVFAFNSVLENSVESDIDYLKVNFESSNSDVVYITDDGSVVPMKTGEAEIKVTLIPNMLLVEGYENGSFGMEQATYNLPEGMTKTKTIKVKVVKSSSSDIQTLDTQTTTATSTEQSTSTEQPASTEKPTSTEQPASTEQPINTEDVFANVDINKNLSVRIDKKKQLNLSLPQNAEIVSYTSKNTKIATVNKKGVVKGIKAGTTKVVVKVKIGEQTKNYTINVKVNQFDVDKTKVKSKLTVKVGNQKLIPVTLPDTTKTTKLTYTVKNTKIATVNKKGMIKGIKAGTTKATVKVKIGKLYKTFTTNITVK